MKYKKVACKKCHATFEVEEALTSYSCPHCHAIHVGDRSSEPAVEPAAPESLSASPVNPAATRGVHVVTRTYR